MIIDRKTREEVSAPKQVEIALGMLAYNQNLVQFADNKANALLLINSIFIASAGAFIETIRRGGQGLESACVLVFFVSSIISILLSFAVVVTRKVPEESNRVKGMVFCSHITGYGSAQKFVGEFASADARTFLEGLLNDIYYVAHIAEHKFAIYNFGQTFTLVSSAFWILSMAMLFLGK